MGYAKVFRDPVHTNIEFDLRSPAERLAVDLINTPPVQRLRHIRQLALANQVYHGAEHSRFSHTLGVAHLAKRLYSSACANSDQKLDPKTLALVLASAVLHDTGHHPFSHAVESVLGIDHEHCTATLITTSSPVRELLHGFGGPAFAERVAAHITGESDEPTAGIISGQLDADRMDYVLRDGYHAGVPNSQYDCERILQLVSFDSDGLIWDARAQTAIEGYFIARYHLYLQLYYHKTNRATEVILRGVLRRAKELADGGADLRVDQAIADLLLGRSCEASLKLSDHDLWSAFRVWATHDDRILADLSDRLRMRRLFKSVDLPVHDTTRLLGLKAKAESIAAKQGLDPSYYVVLDEAGDTPYKVVDISAGDDPHITIRMRGGGGDTASLERHSGIIQQLHREAYNKSRLCFPAEVHDALL